MVSFLFPKIVLSNDFNSHHGMWTSRLLSTSGRNLVEIMEKYNCVVLNTVIFDRVHLVGHTVENIFFLTIVSISLDSDYSSTIINDLLCSDHSVICTDIRCFPGSTGCSSELEFLKVCLAAFQRNVWLYLDSYSVILRHSYQFFSKQVFWTSPLTCSKNSANFENRMYRGGKIIATVAAGGPAIWTSRYCSLSRPAGRKPFTCSHSVLRNT